MELCLHILAKFSNIINIYPDFISDFHSCGEINCSLGSYVVNVFRPYKVTGSRYKERPEDL